MITRPTTPASLCDGSRSPEPEVASAVGAVVATLDGCSLDGAVVAAAVVEAEVGFAATVAGADVGWPPPLHASAKRPAATSKPPRRTTDMVLLVLGARGTSPQRDCWFCSR